MEPTMEHPYVTRLRRAKAVFDRNRSDHSPLRELHADDVVLHAPGDSPLGGGIYGRENIFARLRLMAELSSGTFRPVSTSIAGNGDFVSLLHKVTATRNGKRLDQTLGELWRLDGDKCVEVWAQFSDQEAWDEFWR